MTSTTRNRLVPLTVGHLSRRVTREELRRMNQADAIRSALTATGADATRARQWLHRRGVTVAHFNHAAKKVQPRKNIGLLTEDGVVDLMAVDLVVTSQRQVQLTPTERLLAATRILAAGGGVGDVAQRMGVEHTIARRLVNRITAELPAPLQEEAA
ncbi:hypothetical protein AB0B45_22245 [Nonomuraea sp. NPDC049152]|uniref:hypothetical protein n=1 Tax=Nonomuraea sp. NPDC049152 TaxID=3154350 RepID=UPI0033E120B5